VALTAMSFFLIVPAGGTSAAISINEKFGTFSL
jgi:hypothetical protein